MVFSDTHSAHAAAEMELKIFLVVKYSSTARPPYNP